MLETFAQGPRIHTVRKTLSKEHDRAIDQACAMAVGVEPIIPIIHGPRVLGWVHGSRHSTDVWFRPMRPGESQILSPFTGMDDIINQTTSNGKMHLGTWYKRPLASGFQPQTAWIDFWPCAGYPCAGAYSGTALTARKLDDTMAGAWWHGGNVSTATKHLTSISFWCNGGSTPVMAMMYDRVVDYQNCTIASTTQTMDNTATIARYDGTTGIARLQIMPTVQVTMGAARALGTWNYKNQANSAAAVPNAANMTLATTTCVAGVNNPAMGALSPSGQPFVWLAAGDYGVRSITDYTFASSTTGTLCLSLVAPLAYMTQQTFGQFLGWDTVRQYACLERLIDGAHVSFMNRNATGNTDAFRMHGSASVAWG